VLKIFDAFDREGGVKLIMEVILESLKKWNN
jgi:hypothetical protein